MRRSYPLNTPLPQLHMQKKGSSQSIRRTPGHRSQWPPPRTTYPLKQGLNAGKLQTTSLASQHPKGYLQCPYAALSSIMLTVGFLKARNDFMIVICLFQKSRHQDEELDQSLRIKWIIQREIICVKEYNLFRTCVTNASPGHRNDG